MTDPKIETPTVDADETELRTELEADGELLDDAGKPLPWNHPKRVRKLYKEAKDSRKLTSTLKDLGVKSGDLPAVIAEYREFKGAYEKWQAEQAQGATTEVEDEEAVAAKKQADKIRKALRQLGVKFDDGEAPAPKTADVRKQQVISSAYDKMGEIAEEMGFNLDAMESKARNRFMRDLDTAVGDLLEDDTDARDAFIKEGSLRPIAKYARKVLEARGGKPKTVVESKVAPKGSGIKNLPPRASGSSPGSHAPVKDETTPTSVKDATAQMVADLRARRMAAHKEE